MGRNLADTIVGGIRDPYAVPRACLRVDRVEAGADPAHDAEARQRCDDAFGDGGVLQQDAGASGGCGNHLVLGLALRCRQLDARGGEEVALEIEIRKLVVGEEDFGHGRDRRVAARGEARSATRQRYVAGWGLVKRSDRFRCNRHRPMTIIAHLDHHMLPRLR
jgi:hypothetical protein